MPLYLLSNNSYVKDNIFKFGYFKKSYNELLLQYAKSKRTIINPFIIKWWNIESSIKIEKEIHKVLKKDYKIENICSEWYKCDSLSYIINKINNEINIKHKNYMNNQILLYDFNRYSIFKFMIMNNIGISIKNYVDNLDKTYFNEFVKITSLNIFNLKFFAKKFYTCVYIDKLNYEKIKTHLCNIVKKYNSAFFINYINIESQNIEVEFEKYKRQFSKKEYNDYIKQNKNNIIKKYNVLNYYAEIIFLTNEDLKEKIYKIDNIDNMKVLDIMNNYNFHNNLVVYFKNNIINIKRYTLYQLLNYRNKTLMKY